MWSNDEFDFLIEEAIKCDKALKVKDPEADDKHLVSVD
jgi:hypothetical protein